MEFLKSLNGRLKPYFSCLFNMKYVVRCFYIITIINILSLIVFGQLVGNGVDVSKALKGNAAGFSVCVLIGCFGLFCTYLFKDKSTVFFALFLSMCFLCFPVVMITGFIKPVSVLLLLSLTLNYFVWCWFITCSLISTYPNAFPSTSLKQD